MSDGTPYSPDIKAEAIALVKYEGMSQTQAAAELAKRYPERAPCQQSVAVWTAQDSDLSKLSRERMRDLWADQVALNELLIERARAEAPHLKGQGAIVGQAIGVDKELRIIQEITGPKAATVNVEKMFIITNAARPDIIEGEVVERVP